MASGMGNSIHLSKGSEEPSAPELNVVRVYGMKLCPYTQRLKLVLAAKGIKHETINIDQTNQPEWFQKKSPYGCLPVLEVNGELISDSDIAARYVDEAYPGIKLSTVNPLKKAQEQMLLNDCRKVIKGYYEAAFSDDEGVSRANGLMKLKEGLESLDEYLQKAGTTFICGDSPGLTDYLIWTHLERIGALFPICISQYRFVQYFFNKMGEDEAVHTCRWSNGMHRRYTETVRNKEPNYDITDEYLNKKEMAN